MKLRELNNFITPNECDELINYSNGILKSVTAIGDVNGDHRIAKGIWIDKSSPLINSIKEKISNLSNLPIENQERIHIVKYEVGGVYKPHYDYFPLNEVNSVGNREYSFLIYLNDDYIGGSTRFDVIGREIKPLKGKLVYWKNTENGNPITKTLHSSTEIQRGEKWIAVIWVRENKFG